MPTLTSRMRIATVDPQREDAMALQREAAIEARALYPELHAAGSPWPTNPHRDYRAGQVFREADRHRDRPRAASLGRVAVIAAIGRRAVPLP
jgi:hypothetical protein